MNPAVRPPRQQPLLPPHLRRDSAHPCRICAGTGVQSATSAPGLLSPDPQSAPRSGSSLPHLHRRPPPRPRLDPCRISPGCGSYVSCGDCCMKVWTADGALREETLPSADATFLQVSHNQVCAPRSGHCGRCAVAQRSVRNALNRAGRAADPGARIRAGDGVCARDTRVRRHRERCVALRIAGGNSGCTRQLL